MPAIVGTVNVNAIGGIFNIGDVGKIAPYNFSKTFAGGGSFNSGETLNVNNASSVINVYGSDSYAQYTPLADKSNGFKEEATA